MAERHFFLLLSSLRIMFIIFLMVLLSSIFGSELERQTVPTLKRSETWSKVEPRSIIQTLADAFKQSFQKLSSQLEENDRKLGKTLSIFENQWIEKTNRLNNLEQRQQNVESAIMKLAKQVHRLQTVQLKLAEETSPSTKDASSESIDVLEEPQPTKESSVVISSKENLGRIAKTEIHDNELPSLMDLDEFPSLRNSSVNLIVDEVDTDVLLQSNDEASLYLVGSPLEYLELKSIPVPEQVTLTSIEFHYLKIDPKVLQESLQNCTKLETLKMIHVKLTKPLTEEDRVVLPNLRNFVLDQVGVLQFNNDTVFSKWTEVDELLKGVDEDVLRSFLFFDKNHDESWDIEEVSSLDTNIQLMIDGVKLLVVNHDIGKLTSMLKHNEDFLNELDPNFDLNSLALSSWKTNLDVLPLSIRKLNFNYILDPNESDFSRKLARFTSLEDLNFFLGNQRDFGHSLKFLGELPLRNLTIRYSDVRDFPKTISLRLDNLYLHLCQMNLEFAEYFPEIFQVHQRIGITFRKNFNESTFSHHDLLNNILKTTVKRIFMQNFIRNPRKDLLNIAASSLVYQDIERFLLKSGICGSCRNFLLELQPDGTWSGKALFGDELSFLTYKLIGASTFTTFDAYRKITE